MLLLLPPSEGKTAPVHGEPLDLGSLLGAPALTPVRRAVMDELAAVSARPDAAAVLGLGPRSAEDARLNRVLDTAPTAPAHDLYTGVLYEAADLHALAADPSAHHVLSREVVILSGLWGALAATDAVPDHRLSMSTTLPATGRLAARWRPLLAPVLTSLAQATGGLVVDCRSGAYSPAWQPTVADGLTLARVRAVRRAADGRLTTVSHWAKHARGLLAGAVVDRRARAPRSLSSLEDVAGLASGLDGVTDVELSPADRAGRCDLTLHLG